VSLLKKVELGCSRGSRRRVCSPADPAPVASTLVTPWSSTSSAASAALAVAPAVVAVSIQLDASVLALIGVKWSARR
jgi:hypothetical protein